MSDDPMIAEAYKQLEKAKAVTWGGLTKDQQVVVLMVGFAQDAVAEAVKEERNWWHEQTVRLAEAEQVRLAERDEAIVELNQMAAEDRKEIADANEACARTFALAQTLRDELDKAVAEARREERAAIIRGVCGAVDTASHVLSNGRVWGFCATTLLFKLGFSEAEIVATLRPASGGEGETKKGMDGWDLISQGFIG